MQPTLSKGASVYIIGEAPGCFLTGTPLFLEQGIGFLQEQAKGQNDISGGKILKDLGFQVTEHPVVKFRPKKFPEYTCTSQHKLLVASKILYTSCGVTKGLGEPRFVTAETLTWLKGKHYLCIPKEIHLGTLQTIKTKNFKRERSGYNDVYLPDEILLDKELAFALGMFIGDGTAGRDGIAWCLSKGYKEVFIPQLEAVIKRFGRAPVVRKTADSQNIYVSTSGRSLAEMFRHFFYDHNGEKTVPSFIKCSTPEIISAFLFGWFVTDGKKGNIGTKKGLKITTSSKRAAWQAIQLGLNANVLLGLNPEKPNVKAPKHYKMCYHITFDNSALDKLLWPIKKYPGVRSKNYGEDADFYYVPISYVKSDTYTGIVYDKTTEQHFYSIPFIVHNSNEDEVTGRPFTGPSGKLIRECIPDGEKCSFDNLINCRPPQNRNPTQQEAQCCYPRRVKFIEEIKPRLILGLGVVPLQAIMGTSDMVGMRGRVFAVKIGSHACWFLPTYHQSFILRLARDQQKPLNSMFGNCFKQDVKKAFELAHSLEQPIIDTEADVRANIQCFDGSKESDFHNLTNLLERATLAPIKAIDLETKGLHPWATDGAIMTAAISFENTNFAFALHHPKSGWSVLQLKSILALFKSLIEDDTIKVAHNAIFEIKWLIKEFGPESINHAAWQCSQMQAHFLDERKGQRNSDDSKASRYQALDFLVKQYFGISYKSLFKLNKKDMSQSDLGETLIYNAADTKLCLRLFLLQDRLLEERGLLDAYLDSVPRQPTVALMQHLGVPVDQKACKAAQNKLKGEIKALHAKINSMQVVKKFIADRKGFNPFSQPDVLTLFKDYLKRPEVKVQDKSGKDRLSVDKNILDKIDHPLAALIVQIRNRSKMKSTYVDELELGKGSLIFPDGKLHANLNTTFAETGRTSCVAPWSPVRTLEGVICIKDVVVGDLVWTHKNRWKPVKAIWIKGIEQMLNVHLSNGQILTCTKKHRLLLTNNKWAAVGDLYGFFQKMDLKTSKYPSSAKVGTQQRIKINRRNSSGARNKGCQYTESVEAEPLTRRIQNTENVEILTIKIGQQESYARKNRREKPQLEGGMQRRLRIPDHQSRGKEDFCAPSSNEKRAGASSIAAKMGSSSHRQQPTQQPPRQSSSGYWKRTPGNPSSATSRYKIIEIEKIEVSGSFEVFDLTVEDDSSYETCGVFSHNSDEPNMQNYPKRSDEWLRAQIVPPPGHLLVAIDFGQLEACTGAMCSKDTYLVKALWEDYDIHAEWSRRTALKCPELIGGRTNLEDKGVMKKFRSLIKNKLVFPAFFGATSSSVKGYLRNATGYDVDQSIVDDLMDEFWNCFSGMAMWQKRTMKQYYDVGYVESLCGRRHHYPLTRNQAINMPIQSSAAELVCDAMNRLSYIATTTGQWHFHPHLNVHDDLSFFIPDDDKILDESLRIISREMLTFDYDWINVPLSIEISIGRNWADIYPLEEKIWSHREFGFPRKSYEQR